MKFLLLALGVAALGVFASSSAIARDFVVKPTPLDRMAEKEVDANVQSLSLFLARLPAAVDDIDHLFGRYFDVGIHNTRCG